VLGTERALSSDLATLVMLGAERSGGLSAGSCSTRRMSQPRPSKVIRGDRKPSRQALALLWRFQQPRLRRMHCRPMGELQEELRNLLKMHDDIGPGSGTC
jgi:hypothetical protein